MTLNLSPDAEAQVRSVAATRGQDPEDALIALLNQALAKAEEENRRTQAALNTGVTERASEREVSSKDRGTQMWADEHTIS